MFIVSQRTRSVSYHGYKEPCLLYVREQGQLVTMVTRSHVCCMSENKVSQLPWLQGAMFVVSQRTRSVSYHGYKEPCVLYVRERGQSVTVVTRSHVCCKSENEVSQLPWLQQAVFVVCQF